MYNAEQLSAPTALRGQILFHNLRRLFENQVYSLTPIGGAVIRVSKIEDEAQESFELSFTAKNTTNDGQFFKYISVNQDGRLSYYVESELDASEDRRRCKPSQEVEEFEARMERIDSTGISSEQIVPMLYSPAMTGLAIEFLQITNQELSEYIGMASQLIT